MLGSLIGMQFMGFVTLAVISLVAALFMHYALHYRVVDGFDGFLWKWVVGWIGAWLGSPLLGDWFRQVRISHVYIIAALLGAFAGAFVATYIWKAEAKVLSTTRKAN